MHVIRIYLVRTDVKAEGKVMGKVGGKRNVQVMQEIGTLGT